MHHDDISYFARTHTRNQRIPFGIKQHDRLSHMYILGKTGAGKSTLLEHLLVQDIAAGRGLALIDPHGDLVASIAARIPEYRQDDVIYFDVPNPKQPYGYNPLKFVRADKRPLAASGILEVFEKAWSNAWGNRMEHIIRNALLALLDHPESTLPDILRLLTDKPFRKTIAGTLENARVRDFWLTEYEKYSYRMRAEAIVPIQNKVGAFLADPVLYAVLTNPKKPLQFRRMMDEQQILLVNLAKGKIGEDASRILGGLLVTTIGLAAFSRADVPAGKRCPFLLYVDEFQNYTTLSVANMTSELRKYAVGLVLANQYLYQLPLDVRYAVLGNAGTFISFRLGAQDAPLIGREFAPNITATDLVHLPNYHIYVKLMIDAAPSKPFSAETLAPGELPDGDKAMRNP